MEERIVLLIGKGLESLPQPRQYFIGRSFFELYPDNAGIRGQYARALKEENVFLTARLGEHVFETTFSPLRMKAGEVAGITGFAVDVAGRAERPTDNVDTTASDTMKNESEFVTQVSHELRTPLNSIVGFASLLAKNQESHFSDQDLFYLQRIIGNATHLLNVAGEMLNYSTIGAGKLKVTIEEMDLEKLITETTAELRGHPRATHVQIHVTVPKDLRPMETDRQKLKQIIINLLGNALKFTERGSITVRVEADEFLRPVRIDVIDTGVGIEQEEIESIFRAFERGHQVAGKETEGAGLGLTISQSLAELMGYTIAVQSKRGSGATFSIHLRPPSIL